MRCDGRKRSRWRQHVHTSGGECKRAINHPRVDASAFVSWASVRHTNPGSPSDKPGIIKWRGARSNVGVKKRQGLRVWGSEWCIRTTAELRWGQVISMKTGFPRIDCFKFGLFSANNLFPLRSGRVWLAVWNHYWFLFVEAESLCV